MTATRPSDEGPIIAAVDFSADSERALLWAARQARLEGAPLLVLHVVHDPAASPGFYHKPEEDWLRPMVDAAEQMMKEFLAKARADHPEPEALASAKTRLVSGLPAGRISEVAEEVSARMVVLGSRGRTGLEAVLLGSVAERVAQISPAPVVVVKAPQGNTGP